MSSSSTSTSQIPRPMTTRAERTDKSGPHSLELAREAENGGSARCSPPAEHPLDVLDGLVEGALDLRFLVLARPFDMDRHRRARRCRDDLQPASVAVPFLTGPLHPSPHVVDLDPSLTFLMSAQDVRGHSKAAPAAGSAETIVATYRGRLLGSVNDRNASSGPAATATVRSYSTIKGLLPDGTEPIVDGWTRMPSAALPGVGMVPASASRYPYGRWPPRKRPSVAASGIMASTCTFRDGLIAEHRGAAERFGQTQQPVFSDRPGSSRGRLGGDPAGRVREPRAE